MAVAYVLEVQERSKSGTNAAKQVRKKGLVPAVIYGKGEVTESLSVPADLLNKAIRQGVRIFDVTKGGAMQKALLREVQWDPLGHDVLHADFYRVSADEKITLEVKVELRGTSPGVTGGGVLVQQIHSLSVECLIVNIPESIRVLINDLQIDQAIHVKDLQLPEGVAVMNDPEAIVVQVSQKVIEEEAPAAAPLAGEQAEPEVIARAKPEEEEADEKKK
ncbi:MAG: 50S ribosomal protein L25 [Planctomycetes bacterium]|jgi:large subunit ribosomal protein L25|nr:50S ribosomal protein L25 [Planctomycetota bacterium]